MEKAHHEIANTYIFVKLLDFLKEEKCIWSSKQKDQVTHEGQRIKLVSDFITTTFYGENNGTIFLKIFQERKHKPSQVSTGTNRCGFPRLCPREKK